MQTVSTDQLVGQNIGNYSVKSLLGRGRLSAVYLAQHPAQKNTVALTTFILPERFSTETRTRFMQRFTREAATLTALSHRNLLPIHEYGEQFGYPYLITPYVTNGSLADTLKQQGRCTPTFVLEVLEQVAAGLEYAHHKGVVHGTLKPSNILLSNDQTYLVAGFGLVHMLQVRGIEPSEQPYAHLLSIADTFLYASTYIAPEIVQGQPIDPRSDIYALGVMLFELLSGKPPFTGASPLDTAMQHVQQPLPSLHKLSPDIPIAMELVINHALVRDPNQRFQHIGEVVEAFAQVWRGSVSRPQQRLNSDTLYTLDEATGPEHLQNVQEEEVSIGNWQLTPPIITGKNATVRASHEDIASKLAGKSFATTTTDSWQIMPPIVTGRIAAVKPATRPLSTKLSIQPAAQVVEQNTAPIQQTAQPVASVPPSTTDAQSAQLMQPSQPIQRTLIAHSLPGETSVKDTDLMKTPEWWVQASAEPAVAMSSSTETPEGSLKLPKPDESHVEQSNPLPIPAHATYAAAKRSRSLSRRNVVALLATSGVAAAGALVALNLGHILTPFTSHSNSGSSATPGKQTGNGGQQNGASGHNGKVVGAASLAPNSSLAFTNPTDGKASLLIHLPNGHFVAYERACTHEGVTVNYDPATHTIVCPAHGSVFDPTNGAKVLQGPAQTPLAHVAIRVNADGTITTG